jgi:hypothetical protein
MSPPDPATWTACEVIAMIAPLLGTDDLDDLDGYVIVGIKNGRVTGTATNIVHFEGTAAVLAEAAAGQARTAVDRSGGTRR